MKWNFIGIRPYHDEELPQVFEELIADPAFQQLAIIREMVKQIGFNGLEIVGCPIVREEDGLALSSRNKRLSAEERENALNISRTLFKSRNFAATHTVSETQKMVEDAIEAAPGLRMEYFEIVDGNTLQKISNWEDTSYAVGCITVFCGEVRLIDNTAGNRSLCSRVRHILVGRCGRDCRSGTPDNCRRRSGAPVWQSRSRLCGQGK